MNVQVQGVLDKYADALRARDLQAVLACFTDDAVVAAQGAPTAAGDEVPGLYGAILNALTLDIGFMIETTVEATDGTVSVFTRSAGQQTDLATGVSSVESNREAFVLRPSGDSLKIARYLFNVAPN